MRKTTICKRNYGIFKINKKLREDKNLTVDELAKRLSIDAEKIERAESGDDNLDEKTLEEIARYFGVQYDSLVNGTVKSGKRTRFSIRPSGTNSTMPPRFTHPRPQTNTARCSVLRR